MTAETTDAMAVARVSWTTTLSGPTQVVFSDGTTTFETPADNEDSAVLVGVSADSDVYWQVLGTDEDQSVCSSVQTAQTGSLDANIPEMTVVGENPSGDYVIVPILIPDTIFVVTFDSQGRIVWAVNSSIHIISGPFRAVLARGGGAILSAKAAVSIDDMAVIDRHTLDGTLESSVEIEGGHTDMVELPDGTIAMLGWDIQTVFKDRRLLGDTIIERLPDGTQRVLWNSFDVFEPDPDRYYENSFYEADLTVEDWTHGSGLHYSEDEDAYYVTLRRLSALVKVNRDGTTEWTAKRKHGTVTTDDILDSPHSVEQLPDGSFLVFNAVAKGCSDAVLFEVDLESESAKHIATYQGDDCLDVYFLGDARLQSDDSVLVSWSSSGRLETFTEDGLSAQQIDLPIGAGFGFIDITTNLYEGP